MEVCLPEANLVVICTPKLETTSRDSENRIPLGDKTFDSLILSSTQKMCTIVLSMTYSFLYR
jgi:hypothetical protein